MVGKEAGNVAKKIRIIEATNITPARLKRVAAYARVSMETERLMHSLSAQISYYSDLIQKHPGWVYAGVFADYGVTGTKTDRPEFQRMLAECEAGSIDIILTKSISRLGRNTVDQLNTIRHLKELGIEVQFEKENIWTFDGKGELLITIMSSLAQEESRSISENVTWGQRKRMADGKVAIPFRLMLGFKRGPNGEILIDEEQAKTVRNIYSWFLQGMTPHAIARKLTDLGIPSPSGKDSWYDGTVRSILTNEKYKGDALMQKYYTEDFLTKKLAVNKGEIPQYYVEGSHEAIIKPETYELVQQEFLRRKGKNGRYSGVDLFSSRIVCGQCGAYYGAKVWHSKEARYRRVIFRCNRKYEKVQKCTTPHVTEEQLKVLYTVALNRLIECRDEIITGMMETADELYATDALEAEEHRLLNEMNVRAEMMQQAISKNARVALDQTEYQKKFDELSSRYAAVKAEHDEVVNRISNMLSARKAAQQFISTLRKLDTPITEFSPDLWGALLDHATVYADDDIRFTFRNGAEIRA